MAVVGSSVVSRRIVLTHVLWLLYPLILPVIALPVYGIIEMEINLDLICMTAVMVFPIILLFLFMRILGFYVVLNATFEQFTQTVDGVLRERGLDWDVDDLGQFVLKPSGVQIGFSNAYYAPSDPNQPVDEHHIRLRYGWEDSGLVREIVRDWKRAFKAQKGTKRWIWGFVMAGFGLFISGCGWMLYSIS